MTSTTHESRFTGPTKDVPRDRWGRPMLPPPQPLGAKPIAYTRATTVAKALDDTAGLMLWKQRMTLLGLVARRDLLIAAAATSPEDSKALNRLATEAADAGGATAAATTGTALHAFTERLDRGMDVGHVPAEHVGDLDAYQQLARDVGWRVRAVEQFTALDPYRVAGTADRVLEIGGRWYIADLKTGSSVGFHHAWAIQFAIYAHAIPFDIEHMRRVPWERTPELDRALVIHLPAGKGRASAHWIDIAAGWDAFRLAMQARTWLARKDLLTPYTAPGQDPLLAAIEQAPTVDALHALWTQHRDDGWTPAHTRAAAARKAVIA